MLFGKMLYLTMKRPDIAFCVQTLSQFLQDPKKSYIEATLRVVKYVKNQPGKGVLLSSNADDIISAYSDADWASCPQKRSSITGYFVKVGESLISWKSKKQTTISKSSAETEFNSLAAVTTELVWILGLMKEVGNEVVLLVDLFSDSKSVLQIAANPIYHERTTHIDIDCFFLGKNLCKE
ncbi:secreted RxLR effector protein 161-like [Capsicum annuum]|uniref:secreted RxLR effector protein 161-like n=1 Tax=Capsicum annuum TaxID=4072 RepID=UPI001FB119BF|nr:secreted RxLR effector protein 161-like [Capsicum annuum]